MRLAQRFPVGEFLAEELAARDWSTEEFAAKTGLPTGTVADIITSKRTIDRDTAARIGLTLGTSPDLWLNLQDRT